MRCHANPTCSMLVCSDVCMSTYRWLPWMPHTRAFTQIICSMLVCLDVCVDVPVRCVVCVACGGVVCIEVCVRMRCGACECVVAAIHPPMEWPVCLLFVGSAFEHPVGRRILRTRLQQQHVCVSLMHTTRWCGVHSHRLSQLTVASVAATRDRMAARLHTATRANAVC